MMLHNNAFKILIKDYKANTQDANWVLDWHRAKFESFKINGKRINELHPEPFGTDEDVKKFLKEQLIHKNSRLNDEEKDKTVAELLKVMHQGGLMYPAGSAVADYIIKAFKNTDKLPMAPVTKRIVNITTTATGFNLDETSSVEKFIVGGASPDSGYLKEYKVKEGEHPMTVCCAFKVDLTRASKVAYEADLEKTSIKFGSKDLELVFSNAKMHKNIVTDAVSKNNKKILKQLSNLEKRYKAQIKILKMFSPMGVKRIIAKKKLTKVQALKTAIQDNPNGFINNLYKNNIELKLVTEPTPQWTVKIRGRKNALQKTLDKIKNNISKDCHELAVQKVQEVLHEQPDSKILLPEKLQQLSSDLSKHEDKTKIDMATVVKDAMKSMNLDTAKDLQKRLPSDQKFESILMKAVNKEIESIKGFKKQAIHDINPGL